MEVSYFSSRALPIVVYLSIEEYDELNSELEIVRSRTLPYLSKLWSDMKSINKTIERKV